MKKLMKVLLYITLSIFIFFVLLVMCDSGLLYPFEKPEYVCVEPGVTIAYNELDDPPVYFSDYIAPITRTKLKLYMFVHRVEITSGEYIFNNTTRFEQLVEILNFSSTNNDIKNAVDESISSTASDYDIQTDPDAILKRLGAYLERKEEYEGNWLSEDGLIKLNIDESFNCVDGGYFQGEYTVNETTYEVISEFIPYDIDDEYYNGSIDIFREVRGDDKISHETIICGEYKLDPINDTITVIAIEPDLYISPTYDDSLSVYNIGDEVVFKKQ